MGVPDAALPPEQPIRDLLAAVLGPPIETCSTDVMTVAVELDASTEDLLRRLGVQPQARATVLRHAVALAARVQGLDRWRRRTGLGVTDQRRWLERAFDAALSAEGRGRFATFHLGREERADRWAVNAKSRALARSWHTIIPQMEAYNRRAAQRLALLREAGDDG